MKLEIEQQLLQKNEVSYDDVSLGLLNEHGKKQEVTA
jgi:hypothetical protein